MSWHLCGSSSESQQLQTSVIAVTIDLEFRPGLNTLVDVGPRQYSQVIWAGNSADTDSAWHWAWCLVGAQKVAVHFPSTHWQILVLSHNICLRGG